jgi:hypothetical protein
VGGRSTPGGDGVGPVGVGGTFGGGGESDIGATVGAIGDGNAKRSANYGWPRAEPQAEKLLVPFPPDDCRTTETSLTLQARNETAQTADFAAQSVFRAIAAFSL